MDYIEIKEKIPKGVWDKISEECCESGCYSYPVIALRCIEYLAEYWEDHEELTVWVPGHWEKKKDEIHCGG